ncbi:Neutral alpha-glucosidase AB [Tritrichomonas foetus]|uniref:Maltase n=1 Tax=Tritrichomonas foetus TaxID=1144522 RepID=A0A1J4KC32_9EUKA|nr:Neutral alpha-glucosidase AB [Tritrichomonas foetus]|eukprot:OHT08530.1 Neutral alpha-glucosidase AB [Tritrichomonas foetus]
MRATFLFHFVKKTAFIMFLLSFFTNYAVSAYVRGCDEMRFCRDNFRKERTWTLDSGSAQVSNKAFTAQLFEDGEDADLQLKITFLLEKTIRVQFLPTNNESFQRFKYSEETIVFDQNSLNTYKKFNYKKYDTRIEISTENRKIEVNFNPFKLHVEDERGSKLDMNGDNLLFFEHHGQKVPSETVEGYTDLIKNGATAVGLDFAFGSEKVRLIGFDEKNDVMNLQDTDEPVRISTMDGYPNYGKVPMVYGHSPDEMIALFWANPSDTFYQVSTTSNHKKIRIVSEGGYLDVFVFCGEFHDIIQDYTGITGRIKMPAMWTLGYHQCKYGYETQDEVEEVMKKLEEIDFPYDSIWIDIDHLKGHAPFVVNFEKFPDIPRMIEKLAKEDRYLVRINDPHLPTWNDHRQYQEAKKYGYFIKNPDNTDFVGECWPGAVSYPDYKNPATQKWWGSQYAYEADIVNNPNGENVYFWNDMNEPSVYNILDGKLPKDCLHYDGMEDRELHNMYALYSNKASFLGLEERAPHDRQFLFSRSFGPGTQRYAFTWSADCWALWDWFRNTLAIQSNVGMEGISLFGHDLGGFSYDTTAELMTRWMQVGAFMYTWYRNHADSFSAHREPYVFPPEDCARMLKVTRMRYQLVPFIYTSVYIIHRTGLPYVQPLFTLWQDVDEYHDNMEEFVLGESILMCPVLYEGATSINLVKPPGEWYAYPTGEKMIAGEIEVDMDSIPLYLRAGKIIPTFSGSGRNMEDTVKFPLTLFVAVDENGRAEGDLYFDDGKTQNYTLGQFIRRRFIYENQTIKMLRWVNEKTTGVDFQLRNNSITKLVVFGESEKAVVKEVNIQLNDVDGLDTFKDGTEEKEKDKMMIYIIIAVVMCVVLIVVSVVVIVKSKKENQNNNVSYETIN